MRTVNELLDQVKANSGIQSDYRLAKTLNLTLNTMSNYRHGRSRPDDLVLSKLAELGGIPPEQVELLAVTLQIERATTDEARALWQRIASRLQAGALHSVVLALLVSVGLITTTPNAHATVTALDAQKMSGSVYYVNIISRRAWVVQLSCPGATPPRQIPPWVVLSNDRARPTIHRLHNLWQL